MKTRTLIAFVAFGLVAAAAYSENTAAVFVAIVGAGQLWHLHNIEVKVDKLLDHYGLHVTSEDLDR